MKKMYKKLSVLLLILSMLAVSMLTACGNSTELSDKVKLGTLNGPTGMGLIDLQDNENIRMDTYQAPDELVQKLISGDVDVACLPSNMGAVLNAKTDGDVVVLTTVVNGVLWLLENEGDGELSAQSMEELKGKTIFASGKGGTPEYVLQALLENAGLKMGEDVKVEWLDAHADVAQKLMATEGAFALLPEPFASTVLSKNEKVEVAVDINDAWNQMTGQELPMGILIAKKEFAESRADDADTLLTLVEASVEDVKGASEEVIGKIIDVGFMDNAVLCEDTIPRLSLTCLSSEENRETLTAFYEILYKCNPAAVGGKMPEESLFY
ncbi:MAG: ABC transporter substrate-binding protein [Clostridiales bacterium]|nr:ABC transporter substrate-binding protein [Candidatus Crickella caballi]